ncbi:ATP-dependent DNA helicase [Streptomyces sp. PRh5]|uniref:UvrD-helicase domain-containing protein n=1 Tax=Streptomyces sp. PRh5 TaxID=1158056 RepID=UPI00044D3C91|nr:UvrD-helicase domain-containing protein [Streptomyces sp. PRh5]EXU67551.1 ATP-dependent DNA helicase [Streptomyces sp. PRh5]
MSARITDPEELKELLGIPFTPEQVACITAPPAPQVIVAGAGSGKTTVMAARVVWLVGTGQVAPDRVLGLTFTNKAAGELAERVRKALVTAGIVDPDPDPGATEEAPGEPVISTYHAFAGQLLKDHGLRVGLEPSARLLADATRFQLAARVLRSAPGPYPALTRPFSDLVTDLLALDAELAEHLVPTGRLRAYDTELLRTLEGTRLTNEALRKVPEAARARQELLGLVEAYREEKRRRDLLDFGDQIAHSATLALDHPEVGRILREQFAVVLLDEYQDTSVAQRLLLSGLFGGGTGHPVTAVGDPCQAIYGWRGASVANLDDFPEHFPHADGRPAERFALSENRRSGGRLLDLANGLAAPLRAMHEGVEALRPAPGAERDGAVRCALLPTHAEELSWLADSIAHLVRTGTPPGEIAVLCRTAGDFAQIQGALVERDVPVEVVGLSGLLHLPEVADLVAVCEVLQDPGANAALVRLLTGPRWRIGPRDLALLGRRARALVSYRGPDGAEDDPDRRLAEAVEGTDPAEVISLADALDTFLEAGGGPDDGLPFSAEARVRFARLAAELRELRRSLADPLMDVLHRVLATTGLEVELSASPRALAARRRETLGNFLDVAAAFAGREGGAAVDGEATLQGFLGFLRTAAQYEKGLDNALPGGENTVKVLTAHKAKGLEWDVVAVPGLVAKQFPSEQSRESWTANAKVLPHELRGDARTLPDVTAWDSKGIAAFKDAMKGHQRTEELRLGYVTFTRPRSLLLGSGHWWGPTQKRPRGPSGFLDALREHCEAGYGEIEAWAEPPEEGAENPALRQSPADRAWPLPLDPAALRHRRRAADVVLAHLARIETAGEEPAGRDEGRPSADGDLFPEPPEELEPPEDPEWPEPPEDPYGSYEDEPYDDAPPPGPYDAPSPDPHGAPEPGVPETDVPEITSEPAADEPTPEEARLIGSWDRDLDALAGELRRARETVHEVPLPGTLTASQLLRLAADPDGFARELARPMPRPPRPAARRGTRFHAWVESRFEALPLPFLGPDELPGGEDDEAEIADERDLAALKEAFARTPYARRTPYRVEVPVQLTLAGRTIRGRVDAVYRESGTGPDDGPRYEIVDWKTGRSQDADPLQLAIYRVAWAEQHGLPLSAVTAAFVYVRSGEVVRPAGLPGRAGLERVLLGESGDADAGGDGDVDGDVAIGRDGDGDVGRDGDADIGWDGDADTTGNDRIDAGNVTESERT